MAERGGRDDRRKAAKARPKARTAADVRCPECGARMVHAISGLCCPRFSACGRGGVEETIARIKPRTIRAGHSHAEPRAADASGPA